MKAALATCIGVLSLAAASALGAFIFEKKIALAPSRPGPASILAGDRAAETDRRSPPGNSLEDRASAAVENAAEALKAVLGNHTVRTTDPTDRSPVFDVARIEPTGEAVIAGRAPPGATVELLRAGELHDRTLANEAGEFVLVPRPLPLGNYDLTLRSTQQNGQKLTSKGSVAVVLGPRKDDRTSVAAVDPRKDDRPTAAPIGPRKDDRPGVAMAVPDNPIRAPAKPALVAAGLIAIDAVQTKPDGKLYVSGRSAPDGAVRLYLNDAYIASATPSAEGRVAFVIESGVTPGDYRVRLEKVDASGSVQSRAESSLNVHATTFATASAPRSTPAFRQDSQPRPPLSVGPTAGTSEVTANTSPRVDEPALARPAGPPEVTANGTPRSDEPASSRSAGPPEITANRTARSDEPASSRPAGPPEITANRTARSDEPALPPPPLAAETKSRPTAAAAPGDETGVVVVPTIETAVVARGDNLWRISRMTYGRGVRYPIIFDANRDQIRKPDLIYPGQVFVLPHASDN
jgi:nucleoid-associated protein YgaU